MQKIYPIGRVYAIRSNHTDEIYIGSRHMKSAIHQKFLKSKLL